LKLLEQYFGEDTLAKPDRAPEARLLNKHWQQRVLDETQKMAEKLATVDGT